MKSIALSGLDGVGKTQQISLLKLDGNKTFHFTNPLVKYDERWPDYKGTSMGKWWFEDVSPDLFVDIILSSLKKRSADTAGGKISIHDRSVNMFKAVVAATFLTRGIQREVDILNFVDTAFEEVQALYSEETEIVLIPSDEYQSSIQMYLDSINFETETFSEQNEIRYQRYQSFLKKMLEVYVYPLAQPIIVDAPIVDIQNRIRSLLNGDLSLNLQQFLSDDTLIIALGGLSECGKSSFANHFRGRHGFFRLKQKYFYDLVESHYGVIKPDLVVLEMLRFFQSHTITKNFTLESLHDPAIPAMLKLFFGTRAKIVFIDTSIQVRSLRCADEEKCDIEQAKRLIAGKDALKIARGAELVKAIADQVVNNDVGNFVENSETILVKLVEG